MPWWILCATLALSSGRSLAADIRYDRDVRPILAEHCLGCHGPDAPARQADLRLDTEDGAKPRVIVPHRPDESEFIRRLLASDPAERMPPPDTGRELTATEIDTLRRWVEAGAPYEKHWAFSPIKRPVVPSPVGPASTDIDRFLVAAREARGVGTVATISRRELIRRATYDLTGLPPNWEEVAAFEADSSPQAFATVVDRLLASPRYGERWGRHWLDIARYADTHGGSAIGFTKFPFSYTYRDYVVQSFNGDVPWNRFVAEQVAADQMGLAETDPALAALGFLTIGMQFRNRNDLVDDQIDVVSRGLMGLTIACARCHDHKYDPISTADYYSLHATLAASRPPETLPVIGTPAETPALAEYRHELQRRRTVRDDMATDQVAVMQGRLRMQVGLYLRELAKGTPEQDLSSAFLSFRTDEVRPHILNRWRDYLAAITDNDPVFGPWIRLRQLPADQFATRSSEIVAVLLADNGDPAAASAKNGLAEETPKWNPLVLAALADRKPESLADVADAYGFLFAEVHRQWLKGLAEASEEAVGDGIITDEDPRHATINSPIHRPLRHHLFADGTPTMIGGQAAQSLLNRTVQDTLAGKGGAIHDLHLGSPGSPPRSMVLTEQDDAGPFHILRRGNAINRGEVVEARFPTILAAAADNKPFPAGRRRLGLAAALVSPDNPLLRRVIVNWAWQRHFGAGLVRTPDDFGTRGQPPTHPELLDHLASGFLDDGWSLKSLHRRIMLSDAYRLGATEVAASRQVDPDDELLWRMPRRRLDVESMRDAMLAVSGELDTTMGGAPVDLAAAPIIPRRSIYGFVNRDIVSSLSGTFDGANPTACTVRRPETTIPQQALFALNSDFIQDRAVALSKLAMQAADTDEARVAWLFGRLFSRQPSAEETASALVYTRQQAATPDAGDGPLPPELPWQRLAHVLLAANEFLFPD